MTVKAPTDEQTLPRPGPARRVHNPERMTQIQVNDMARRHTLLARARPGGVRAVAAFLD